MPRYPRLRLILLAAALLLGGAGTPLPARDTPCPTVLPAQPDAACLRALYSGPSAQWPAPLVQHGTAWQELGPLPAVVHPADNPSSPAKVALGQRLFNDPQLSRSGQIACASCHERDLAFADGRRVSFGHDRQAGRRNSPSVAMAAHTQPLFWDGRAATLEAQALMPIADPLEMAFSAEDAVARLRRRPDYQAQFEAVFGNRHMDTRQLAQAIAAFERSLVPRPNRLDRFMAGRHDQLDDPQLRGLHLFRTKAGCMNCHSGPALTNNGFHNLGLHFHGRARQDLGRYEVTGAPADSGRFRTPSLRGVARTAPYMHNGLFPNLASVLRFYNVGGGRPRAPAAGVAPGAPFPQPDPLMQPRALSRQDLQDLEAFLLVL